MQGFTEQSLDNLYKILNELKTIKERVSSGQELANKPNCRTQMIIDYTERIEWLKKNPDNSEKDYVIREITLLKAMLNC
jgi:hypothetical protein